jgi:hypothetical protein
MPRGSHCSVGEYLRARARGAGMQPTSFVDPDYSSQRDVSEISRLSGLDPGSIPMKSSCQPNGSGENTSCQLPGSQKAALSSKSLGRRNLRVRCARNSGFPAARNAPVAALNCETFLKNENHAHDVRDAQISGRLALTGNREKSWKKK